MQFDEMVSSFRIDYDLTFAELTSGLNKYLPADEKWTPMAACHWEHGTFRPVRMRLRWIIANAPAESWQHEFATRAMECLQPVPITETTNTSP